MKKKRKNKVLGRYGKIVFGIDPKPRGIGFVMFGIRNFDKEKKCLIKVLESGYITPDVSGDVNTLKYKYRRNVRLANSMKVCAEKFLDFYGRGSQKTRVIYAIEGYSMASRGRIFDIAEFCWELKRSLYISLYKPSLAILAPGTWKSLAIGNGRAGKNVIMKEIYRRYGFDSNSEDINDAFGIGMAFIMIMNGHSKSKKFVDNWNNNVLGKSVKIHDIKDRKVKLL